jgi:pimeloyl-ACP methyl ester carboxylesterase
MDGLSLLVEARKAGLSVHIEGDKLVVRGPKVAAPIAQRLLANKAQVMAALSAGPAPCSVCGCAFGWRTSSGRVACCVCEPPPDRVLRLILVDYPDSPRWEPEDEQFGGSADAAGWDDVIPWDDTTQSCPTCGSVAHWIDGRDGWHCLKCTPPLRAEKLLRDRERILQDAWRRLRKQK